MNENRFWNFIFYQKPFKNSFSISLKHSLVNILRWLTHSDGVSYCCLCCVSCSRQCCRSWPLQRSGWASTSPSNPCTRKTSILVGCLHIFSTKCSVWAIVTDLCPSSVVIRRPSTSSLKPLIGFGPNFTGMVPGWFPTKVLKMVMIGCISRSRGQKIGFNNAICKNLLVWDYKARSFHIWYIASSRGPLPKLFELCPCGQNWSRPGGHNFTFYYIRKSSNDIFSWTTNGNLTKLNRNGSWVVFY